MESHQEDRARVYERRFLLSPEKRNQVMELWEVEKYGVDSFSDSDYLCIYGMTPVEWYARQIRLLARTVVECVRDSLGESIGKDVERIVHGAASGRQVIIFDPFAGSCNSLYWILKRVRNSKGIACELDRTIFEMTKRNLASLDIDIQVVNCDYRDLLHSHRFPLDHFIVVYVAPPWGDALNEITGLDLRRTEPPVADIVDNVEDACKEHSILWAIQVHQTVDPDSVAQLTGRFAWSSLRTYDVNVEGMKHGVLFGASRWKPSA